MSVTTFNSPFSLGDKVIADDQADLIAVVVGIQWRSAAPSIEIAWFDRGKHETVWIEPWRLRESKP